MPSEHTSIIEIAAIAWDNVKDEIVDTFSTYVRPMDGRIPSFISNLTGITTAQTKNAPNIWDAMPLFYGWIKNCGGERLMGYNNLTFDARFLKIKNEQYHLDLPLDYPEDDIFKLVKKLEKEGITNIKEQCGNLKQTTVAKYFHIDYEAHNAINDVEALLRIYKALRNLDPRII